ncbi:E family RNA polymerase sigma-70 factor [Kibdelosporangium aridum]|uniref:E family RNA polymerase sigma-70 factor n=1 Tax=Kibdelosporangium aridum TaxID=2030 RepID=A0A428ZE92_KIBAR|nr:SigE family RNA polymerase sigma factor [Kibdelosporangium aridum]RSM86394.1 E family RNA polymerase sigma-70 factor [Kibdelosporangium aridum]
MLSTSDDAEFSRCYSEHVASLTTTAYLLCGDRYRAEDLAQSTFLALYLAWDRVDERERLGNYLRTLLLRRYIAQRRASWWRRERTTWELPDLQALPQDKGEDRMVLWPAMNALSARQRAVLVARFWLDLGVDDTARALGCSTGTVKSQTAKALAALRNRLGTSLAEYTRGARHG